MIIWTKEKGKGAETSLPAYFEQAKRILYHDQMLYTLATIVIDQACLPKSVQIMTNEVKDAITSRPTEVSRK